VDENLWPVAKQPQTSMHAVEVAMENYCHLAVQQLADAQEVDQHCHQELIDGFTHLADSMAGLTDVMWSRTMCEGKQVAQRYASYDISSEISIV